MDQTPASGTPYSPISSTFKFQKLLEMLEKSDLLDYRKTNHEWMKNVFFYTLFTITNYFENKSRATIAMSQASPTLVMSQAQVDIDAPCRRI